MINGGIASVAALAALQPGATLGAAAPAAASNSSAPDVFANLLQRELTSLDATVGAAESAMRDLAAGKSVQLHEVMISLERARISVQTFVQVRNKLIESYQDLMRMQL